MMPRNQREERKELVAQSCPTLFDPMDCRPPGSYVHGILQAGTLEWVAIPFSRGSSWPRDQTQVSCIAGRFFNHQTYVVSYNSTFLDSLYIHIYIYIYTHTHTHTHTHRERERSIIDFKTKVYVIWQKQSQREVIPTVMLWVKMEDQIILKAVLLMLVWPAIDLD